MSGSFIFYFHILGFGLITTGVVSGWFLNVRFKASAGREAWESLESMMRMALLLFLFAALLLLATGIGNIFNLYYGTPLLWYQQGWLVVKIILFGVLLVNGSVIGPHTNRKRMKLVRAIDEHGGTEDEQARLTYLHKQMNWFFTVQSVLLLGIVFFSTFGPSKHPGYF